MPQMTQAPAVQASQLTMSYCDKTVLAGTSFTIPRGSVLALLGPNGAGKSTTIDILCGLKRRSSGYVRVLGIDPAHADEAWRARVGVVRQSWRDHERWRVGDLLHHLSQYYGTYSSSEAGWDPDELLRVVGLSSVAAKRIRTLSGGQRRRLDVAIGLVGNPDILFLDEINTVSETLAPTMLQFLQYKTFGTHRVPEGWVIVTAGNPPEYNRAVRDFDVVTKDRVRELRVTADYGVWKGYALQRGMHGAVLAFLDLEPEAFFFVRAGEAGKCFVTARGWEDLSDSLKAYEALRLDVSGAFTASFLQDAEIADKFYRYYLLYRKYAALYDIAGILSGKEEADAAQLKKTGFDEKLSFVALLSAAIGERVRKWQEDFRVQQEVFRILKEIRDAETAGQTAVTEALREARFAAEQRLLREQAAEALSPTRERQLTAVVTRLRHYETLSDAAEPKDAFDALRTAFAADEAARKQREAETGEALSCALRFMAEGFGEGQELALFLTELNENSAVLAFADETGHADYARYNQLLLLRDRRETLKEEVMQFL